jgi:hypothetical protein
MTVSRRFWPPALLVVALGWTPPSLAAAQVTSVTAAAEPSRYTGRCPGYFKMKGRITVSAPGLVTYRWRRSDGAVGPIETLTAAAPGVQEVETSWALGDQRDMEYEGWEKVVVLTPAPMESEPARFQMTCRGLPPHVDAPPPGADPVAVAAVELVAEPREYEGPCPATIQLRGVIMVEGGPGTITYMFVRSDGARGPVESMLVAVPGPKAVETKWTLWGQPPQGTFEGWQRLVVLTPEGIESKPASFRMLCE